MKHLSADFAEVADCEIQIGEIGVICGSRLPFLVSLCLGGGISFWDLRTQYFEADGLLWALLNRTATFHERDY
jgi:hypothetical protein